MIFILFMEIDCHIMTLQTFHMLMCLYLMFSSLIVMIVQFCSLAMSPPYSTSICSTNALLLISFNQHEFQIQVYFRSFVQLEFFWQEFLSIELLYLFVSFYEKRVCLTFWVFVKLIVKLFSLIFLYFLQVVFLFW